MIIYAGVSFLLKYHQVYNIQKNGDDEETPDVFRRLDARK